MVELGGSGFAFPVVLELHEEDADAFTTADES
jgi:hypothetical protein